MGHVRAKSMIERLGFKDPELGTPQHDEIVKWIERNVEDLLQTLFPTEPWQEAEIDRLRNKIKSAIEWQRKNLERQSAEIQKRLDIDKNPEIGLAISGLKVFGGDLQREKALELEKTQQELKRIDMDKWGDLGVPPEVSLAKAGSKWWEFTIKKREAVVGFVDFVVDAELPYLTVKGFDGSSYGATNSKPEWRIGNRTKRVYFEAKVKIPSLGELIRQIRFYQTYEPGIYVVVSPDDRDAEILQSQGIRFIKCPAPVEKKQSQQSLF